MDQPRQRSRGYWIHGMGERQQERDLRYDGCQRAGFLSRANFRFAFGDDRKNRRYEALLRGIRPMDGHGPGWFSAVGARYQQRRNIFPGLVASLRGRTKRPKANFHQKLRVAEYL